MSKNFFRRWFAPATAAPIQETTDVLAQRGNAEAQFSLGLRYATAHGAAQDYAQAEHWYLKAADQNHPLAHFNLGIMHASGHGRPSNRATSLVWFQKAADLGDAGAQFRLGETHHRDVMSGAEANAGQSRIEAYKWFRLAANQGYRGAVTACDAVNLHMTREEVEQGNQQVAAFTCGKTGVTTA